jgi:gamma-glutamyltranspeptidase/glutathione hydrolase
MYLARMLDAIMQYKSNALYNRGRTAHIVEEIQAACGIITKKDQRQYKPIIRDPLVRRFTMVGLPPPSSGGAVVISVASFLSGYKDSIN